MKMNKGFLVLASFALGSCFNNTSEAVAYKINGSFYDGMAVTWNKGDDRVVVSYGDGYGFFSFSVKIFGQWKGNEDFVTYDHDCGHFEFVDSTGNEVKFESYYYTFQGKRDITIIFDEELTHSLELSELREFSIGYHTYISPFYDE